MGKTDGCLEQRGHEFSSLAPELELLDFVRHMGCQDRCSQSRQPPWSLPHG